jgi:hypothetical protein
MSGLRPPAAALRGPPAPSAQQMTRDPCAPSASHFPSEPPAVGIRAGMPRRIRARSCRARPGRAPGHHLRTCGCVRGVGEGDLWSRADSARLAYGVGPSGPRTQSPRFKPAGDSKFGHVPLQTRALILVLLSQRGKVPSADCTPSPTWWLSPARCSLEFVPAANPELSHAIRGIRYSSAFLAGLRRAGKGV